MQVLLISVVCLINRCYSCMQLHSFVWRAGFSQSQFHCIGLTWMFWFPGKKNPYVVFKIRFPFCFTASRGLGTMVLRKWVYVSENQQRARGDWKGGEAHRWCVELIKKTVLPGLQKHLLVHHCHLSKNTDFCLGCAWKNILPWQLHTHYSCTAN